MKTEDESQLKELGRELNPRRLLGRLLGGFGSLFLITGICSPLYSKDHDFSLVLLMVGLGILLVFCAVLLIKPTIVQNRPTLWFPAVSGFLCSCSFLTMCACLAAMWRTPKDNRPDWILQLVFLAMAGCVLFALVCIVTSVSAFMKSRTNGSQPASSMDGSPFSSQ